MTTLFDDRDAMYTDEQTKKILNDHCPQIPVYDLQGKMVAAPDFLAFLSNWIVRRRPKTIVELGSGLSTLVAAACMAKTGIGKLVSLDHERKYADRTVALLESFGLGFNVSVRYAPLGSHFLGSREVLWYDYKPHLDDMNPIDLLVVDGPPGRIGPLARYPALPLLKRTLAARAVIVMDDGRRPDEREIAERWECEFDLRVKWIGHKKGTYVFEIR